MRIVNFAICLGLLLTTPGFCQTLGEITGQVMDSSGGAIPAAKITATNVNTNASRDALSNDAGIYSFPSMQPGVYNLRVEKSGFKAATRTNVQLEVQQNARLDFELTVGQVSESIEVSAQGALLAAENATIGTVIDNKRIVELPLNGRNYLQLVAMAPNVSYGFPSAGQAGSRQGGIRAEQSISVAGQRSMFNHFTLDGVENTDPNFNTFVVLPSIDALQEFKVQTGIYPAEFGREATQINVSTKPGGNEYHGTLFHFLRNDKLDAKNYAFTSNRPPKDPFKWNQFGFTFGGPVTIPKLFNGKNKLFFMSNYEWFRQRRQVQAVSNLPSAAMFDGNFSSLPKGTQGIFDPRTRVSSGNTITASLFPGNIIPKARFHPVSVKLLEFYPAANLASANLTNNFVQARGLPINRDQFVGRMDFIESSNSQWTGRYSWGDENQLTEGLKLNGAAILSNFNQYMGSNTRVLSPTVVTETRFGFTQFYNTTGPELAFSRDVVGELKIPGLASGPPVQWGIPSVAMSGVYSGFGNDSEGPYENNNNSLQFLNNTTILRGKHTFKFGGEIRRDAYNQIGNQFARGQFTFQRNATANPGQSGLTGDPFADFLLGETQQSEASAVIARAQYRSTSFALYFDETWKITPSVTINAGLRYENTPPWEDQTGRLFNAIVRLDVRAANIQDKSLYPYFDRQGPQSNDPYAGIPNLRWPDIEVRQDGKFGTRMVRTDKNDFAPRLGITWAPTSKWVIRTGAGYFYSQDTGNPRFDMARNLAGRLRFNSSQTAPNLNWDNSLVSLASGIVNVTIPYTFANEPDRRTPYTIQYLLNVQRELPNNTVIEAGYLGSVSRHLESLRAVNESLPACPTRTSRPGCENDPLAGVGLNLRSPFPNFGRIQLVDNGNTGGYNSLGSKLTKRFSNGLTYLVSYTWAKSIDTSTGIRPQGGDVLFPQNSYCRGCEKGRSSHDTRHRLVTSMLWDLPFGKGRQFINQNKFADVFLGGWQLGTLLTLQTGFAMTITNGADTSGVAGPYDRPDSLGRNAALPRGQQDPQRFFDTSAFRFNQVGAFGNVGRNTMNGPGIINWDFSMHKDFAFTERHRLQFRFEGFNFANHPNWNNPNTNINSGATFGTITSTRTNMRNLQLALKYSF